MKFRLLCVAVAMLGCTGAAVYDAAPAMASDPVCNPTFREASAGELVASAALWRIEFRVAMIGCKSSLESLSNEDLVRIGSYLVTEPAQQANVRLRTARMEPDFRARAVAGLNEVVGREAVSDVLFHDIAMYDVSHH
jgi:hypothetical protein